MKDREFVFTIRPDREAEFSAAFQKWTQAEPLVRGVSIFGHQAKATLHAVRVLDGPRAGSWHDDRPRAVALVRECIPENAVASATVDGIDWRCDR